MKQAGQATSLLPGMLAISTGNDWGPGKVVAVQGTGVTLEYFDSIGQAEPAATTVPESTVGRFKALPQTRCYWLVGGHWQVGRVVGRRQGRYVVRVANAVDVEVDEVDLQVRWHRRPMDPTDVLVAHGNESPYFHNCRQPFSASLVAQRAACRGLTALLSSVIQLYEHQVEIARRILTDPIQRYLLADEVGLGKTIEAGLVIRQLLLDEPDALVMVLAPDHLRVQWVRELRRKFLLDDFAEARVKILGHDDWQQWSRFGDPSLLVVDEAHHLADPTSESPDEKGRYAELDRLAAESKKTLLLSATPLLHNERTFLGMLHLIDPDLHRLNELDRFKELVANRQDLGRIFFTLHSDSPPFLLEEKAGMLRAMFPHDDQLDRLLLNLEAAIGDATEPLGLEQAVLSVRVHISEAYRLHRRLLRTRRTEAVLDTYPVRGRKVPTGLIDGDPRRQAVDLWLDGWRDLLLFDARRARSGDALEDAASVFWIFLDWSGSDLSQLRKLARGCLDGFAGGDWDSSLSSAELRLLQRFPFEAEAQNLLTGLLGELEEATDVDRVAQTVAFLLHRPRQTKTVVFSRFSEVSKLISEALIDQVSPSAVAVQVVGQELDNIEEELDRFERNPLCRFLICDASAEEGRNLQFADFLLHVDLHANPNRLEQRIGRIDRFSTSGPVESATFHDDPGMHPGYHAAWLSSLVDGFGVFDGSISGMQYAVDAVMTRMRLMVLEGGAQVLREAQSLVRDSLESESRAIVEQDALDAIEATPTDLGLFASLDALENDWQVLKRASEDWISDARGNLRFVKTEDDDDRQIVDFSLTRPGREATLNTMPLIPWDVLATRFRATGERKGTFHRELALRRPGVRLFRIGEPFIDALAEFTEWDDRGRAFTMWRTRVDWRGESDFVALRFDFTIEADRRSVAKAIERAGGGSDSPVAQRTVDSFFPPMASTVWLDVGMSEITDSGLLELLRAPYDPERGDIHLSQRRAWLLDEVVGRDFWEQLVRGGRSRAQQLVELKVDLATAIEGAQRQVSRHSQVRMEQMRVRLAASESGAILMADPTELASAADFEAATLAGVGSPVVRLDSVGVIILSARVPNGPGFTRDDYGQ